MKTKTLENRDDLRFQLQLASFLPVPMRDNTTKLVLLHQNSLAIDIASLSTILAFFLTIEGPQRG